MTSQNDEQQPLDPTRVPIGKDAYGKWVDLRFTGLENPHIMVVGGSQTGKTSLQVQIAMAAASRGIIVVIIDPKQRFERPFRRPVTHEPLPHVLVYTDPDLHVAAREWQGVLDLFTYAQAKRYEEDKQADRKILGDHDRFPTVLVIVDELGRALKFADREWPWRKPDDYRGWTPTREHLDTHAAMGAEARFITCWANQNASTRNMPSDSTDTRVLFGQRILLGNMTEAEQTRMLFGTGIAPPKVPDGQRGAGVLAVGNRPPFRFQGAWTDWENHPEQVYEIAAWGVPALRRTGHIDEHGRLRLAGITVPRPGEMASHVTGHMLDLLPGYVPDDDHAPATEQHTTSEPREQDHAEAPPEPPAPPMVVGLDVAAEFCGMTRANFRKHRELWPIPGELARYKGNKPGWPEPDLRAWAHARGVNRRNRGVA